MSWPSIKEMEEIFSYDYYFLQLEKSKLKRAFECDLTPTHNLIPPCPTFTPSKEQGEKISGGRGRREKSRNKSKLKVPSSHSCSASSILRWNGEWNGDCCQFITLWCSSWVPLCPCPMWIPATLPPFLSCSHMGFPELAACPGLLQEDSLLLYGPPLVLSCSG